MKRLGLFFVITSSVFGAIDPPPPAFSVALERVEFKSIVEVPHFRLNLQNPPGTNPVVVKSIRLIGDSVLHLGNGKADLGMQVSGGERRPFVLTGDPGPGYWSGLFYRAQERPVRIEVEYSTARVDPSKEVPEYAEVTVPVKPLGQTGAIMTAALAGVIFLLGFRFLVNRFIRRVDVSVNDYLIHWGMGSLAVFLAILIFTVAPEKFEGLGITVQPFDAVGGLLVGLSFTTLSQGFIALLAPPTANPVPALESLAKNPAGRLIDTTKEEQPHSGSTMPKPPASPEDR